MVKRFEEKSKPDSLGPSPREGRQNRKAYRIFRWSTLASKIGEFPGRRNARPRPRLGAGGGVGVSLATQGRRPVEVEVSGTASTRPLKFGIEVRGWLFSVSEYGWTTSTA